MKKTFLLLSLAFLPACAKGQPGMASSVAVPHTVFTRSFARAADANAARTVLGTQASDPNLTAIAGLTTAANLITYWTGAGTASTTSLTAFARSLIDDANAVEARDTLDAQMGMWVNVKDPNFGAAGDGVTDDTAAIQAAIDYGLANGMSVYVPNGIYLITDTVTINVGAGDDALGFHMLGSGMPEFRWAGSGSKFIFSIDGLYASTFTGLFWNGNSVASASGVYLTGSAGQATQHVTFKQCEIWGCPVIGLSIYQQNDIAACDYIILDNCTLYSNGINLNIDGSPREIMGVGGSNIGATTYGIKIGHGVFRGVDYFFGINGTCDVYLDNSISSVQLYGCSSESLKILDTNEPSGGFNYLLPPNVISGMNQTIHLPDFNWPDVGDSIDYNCTTPITIANCNFTGDVNIGATCFSVMAWNNRFFNVDHSVNFTGYTDLANVYTNGNITGLKYLQLEAAGNYAAEFASATGGVALCLKDPNTTATYGEALVRSNDDIELRTDDTSRLLIQSTTGNVAIGADVWPPQAKLHVDGDIYGEIYRVYGGDGDSYYYEVNAPAEMAGNIAWIFPTKFGIVGDVLQIADANGRTGWISPSAAITWGVGLSASGGTTSFAPDELSNVTWGSGSGYTWTMDVGATDPCLIFSSGSTVLDSSVFEVNSSSNYPLAVRSKTPGAVISLKDSTTASTYGEAIARSGDGLDLRTDDTARLLIAATTGNVAIGAGVAPASQALVVDGNVAATSYFRSTTSKYLRYYHIPLFSADPGAAGATFVVPGANRTGGWQLNAATEYLYAQSDIHSDWDGSTNPTVELRFAINAAGSLAGDTVDIKIIFYYKGVGDTATKTQTVEVPTTVGTAAQYTQFEAEFPIDWDYSANVLDAGDVISMRINLETDTSEVTDITLSDLSLEYATTHAGIEDGDG